MYEKINYWKRILATYLIKTESNLSFWHGDPKINQKANYKVLDQYYMSFLYKANYNGDFDINGVPMLNYHGDIGLQYNPIAIAQWGLGNYNLWKDTNHNVRYENFIKSADWLVDNLCKNQFGVYVWIHKFDWAYKEKLEKPWYSGLAQGQGLSLLVRAYIESKNEKYLESCEKVYDSFYKDVSKGGVNATDDNDNIWIEEYIVNESTHILNGFIWGLWGIYDYWLLTNDKKTKLLFDKYITTIQSNLYKYDIGYWSLYELSELKIKMRASLFYHKLHIIQLQILFAMTDVKLFKDTSNKWQSYLDKKSNKVRATFMKIIFKIFYY